MLIHLQDVKKYYKTKDGVKKALRGINLTIAEGEFVTIAGPSGSGKTTLISILALLMHQSGGRYFYNGKKIAPLDEDRKAHLRSAELGFIFQDGLLLAGLSVYENCALPLLYSDLSKEEILARCQAALRKVGLEDYIRHKPNQLSGGQQQRVAIARALMNKPRLIIADEPCAALDPETRLDVLKIFQDLNAEGVTILMVSHSIEDAQFSKRIIRIEDGFLTDDSLVVKPEISARRIKDVGVNVEGQVAQLLEIHAISGNDQAFLEAVNKIYDIRNGESLALCLKVLGLSDLEFGHHEEILKMTYTFLDHSNWKVRLLAQRVLAKNVNPAALKDDLKFSEAIDRLVRDNNQMVREEAYLELSKHHHSLDSVFVQICVANGSNDVSAQVRATCAKMLFTMDTKYLLQATRKFMGDADFRVVANAVESLWQIHSSGSREFTDKQVLEVLQALVQQGNNRLKANVAMIYKNLDVELSKQITLELLNHENPSYIASGIYVAKMYYPELLNGILSRLLDLPYKRVHDILKSSINELSKAA